MEGGGVGNGTEWGKEGEEQEQGGGHPLVLAYTLI